MGEFDLIARIKQELGAQEEAQAALGRHSHLLIGIGDDAAAWQSANVAHLATSDTLVAGVHFPAEGVAWADLGWKALSDEVTQPLKGLRVAPYYGCLLLRPPAEIGLDDPDQPTIMADMLKALVC